MAKDWTGSGKGVIRQLGASNHSSEEREAHDYYATSPHTIDDLMKVQTFSKYIWECASGGGHLVKALKKNNKWVFSTDIINRGAQDQIIDFLKTDIHFNGDIITNPPYKYVDEFILKALDVINEGNKVAFFLKLTTLEGQKRYNRVYKKYPPRYIYVYSKRQQCAKNGEFKGVSAVAYAWYIWVKGDYSTTEVKWL